MSGPATIDGCPEEGHAARRWARAILAVTTCATDPKTLGAWAHATGAAPGTLRLWCRTARVSPKASLDLARMIRATIRARQEPWDPLNLLDIVDDRTLRKLLRRAGLQDSSANTGPTLEELLGRQQFVSEGRNLRALVSVLYEEALISRDWARKWFQTCVVR